MKQEFCKENKDVANKSIRKYGNILQEKSSGRSGHGKGSTGENTKRKMMKDDGNIR